MEEWKMILSIGRNKLKFPVTTFIGMIPPKGGREADNLVSVNWTSGKIH